METPPPPLQKKGLGPLAWIGIGCGGIVVLVIVGIVAFTVLFGGKIKQFAEDVQKNPTRTTANAMVTMSAGQFEMVAEDDVNKRYTVREKQNGKLTTIYWDEKKKAPEVVPGDFSAIPAADKTPAAPSEETSAKSPAPEPK
jgi:hypothetical protein